MSSDLENDIITQRKKRHRKDGHETDGSKKTKKLKRKKLCTDNVNHSITTDSALSKKKSTHSEEEEENVDAAFKLPEKLSSQQVSSQSSKKKKHTKVERRYKKPRSIPSKTSLTDKRTTTPMIKTYSKKEPVTEYASAATLVPSEKRFELNGKVRPSCLNEKTLVVETCDDALDDTFDRVAQGVV